MSDGKATPPERAVMVVPLADRRESRGPTEEILQKLAAIVADGNYYNTAYRMVGIPESTFTGWMTKGEADEVLGFTEAESKYRRFSATMKRAQAAAQAKMVHTLHESGKENPISAIIFLERTDRRWARRTRSDDDDTGGSEQVPVGMVEIVRPPVPQVGSSDSSPDS